MRRLESGKYLGTNKQSWDAGNVIISETEYYSRVFEGWHFHENNHITFVLRGGNREQRKMREFEVTPGNIILYKSYELHRNYNTQHPSRNINVEIENNFFINYDLESNLFDADTLSYTDIKFALCKIYRECYINDAQSESTIHSLLLNLFNHSPHSRMGNYSPQWVKSAQEILNDRWNENISLNELANIIKVHPVTISKFFPQYFSCTLGEYVRKIRIEKAIILIRNTQVQLTEIAHQCGFFDQSHFTRNFKKLTGFLPKEYRNL